MFVCLCLCPCRQRITPLHPPQKRTHPTPNPNPSIHHTIAQKTDTTARRLPASAQGRRPPPPRGAQPPGKIKNKSAISCMARALIEITGCLFVGTFVASWIAQETGPFPPPPPPHLTPATPISHPPNPPNPTHTRRSPAGLMPSTASRPLPPPPPPPPSPRRPRQAGPGKLKYVYMRRSIGSKGGCCICVRRCSAGSLARESPSIHSNLYVSIPFPTLLSLSLLPLTNPHIHLNQRPNHHSAGPGGMGMGPSSSSSSSPFGGGGGGGGGGGFFPPPSLLAVMTKATVS